MSDKAISLEKLHSDAWLMRALDGELTPGEAQVWAAHRADCERCRLEWEGLARLDELLSTAPAPPQLSPQFTALTVQRITRQQRWRRRLSIITGALMVALVSIVIFSLFSSALGSVSRWLYVAFSARQMLFSSLMHTLVGVLLSWKLLLPFIALLTGVILLLLMPNGLLATAAILWLRSQRGQVQYQTPMRA